PCRFSCRGRGRARRPAFDCAPNPVGPVGAHQLGRPVPPSIREPDDLQCLHPSHVAEVVDEEEASVDRKSTRLNSSHVKISYAVARAPLSFPTRRSSDLSLSVLLSGSWACSTTRLRLRAEPSRSSRGTPTGPSGPTVDP